MERTRWVTSCALTLLVLGGCAYQRGALAGRSERVLSERRELQREEQPVIRVEQEGTRVSLFAEHQCRAHRHEQLETTLQYARTSAAPGTMITAGVLGGLAIGAGSLFAANVFEFPPDGARGSMDSLNAEEALIGGVVLIAAGGVAVIVAAAHAFGLLGTDDERVERTEYRGPVGPIVGCSPRAPLSGGLVHVVGPGGEAPLGRLSSAGELSLDAARVIEPAFVLQSGERARLEVGGRESETALEMAPFRAQAEARSWAEAQTTRCAAATAPRDCHALERYLTLFPNGAHAAQGRALLGEAQARLTERARQLAAEREAEREREWAEQERRLAEADARRAEYEAAQRARQETHERERRAREAEAAARAQEAAERARRGRERAECSRACRSTCAGDAQCVVVCREQQCR